MGGLPVRRGKGRCCSRTGVLQSKSPDAPLPTKPVLDSVGDQISMIKLALIIESAKNTKPTESVQIRANPWLPPRPKKSTKFPLIFYT